MNRSILHLIKTLDNRSGGHIYARQLAKKIEKIQIGIQISNWMDKTLSARRQQLKRDEQMFNSVDVLTFDSVR